MVVSPVGASMQDPLRQVSVCFGGRRAEEASGQGLSNKSPRLSTAFHVCAPYKERRSAQERVEKVDLVIEPVTSSVPRLLLLCGRTRAAVSLTVAGRTARSTSRPRHPASADRRRP